MSGLGMVNGQHGGYTHHHRVNVKPEQVRLNSGQAMTHNHSQAPSTGSSVWLTHQSSHRIVIR